MIEVQDQTIQQNTEIVTYAMLRDLLKRSGISTIARAIQSDNFSASTGWQLGADGNITALSGTIGGWTIGAATIIGGGVTIDSAGNIRIGKTGFADTVNAGIILGLDGAVPSFYFGTANDASYMKLVGGIYSLVGTISGRSTLTIASAIDSSGNLISDVINTKLDTAAKSILTGFTFGTTDYSGAFMSGDITWNTTTGAITGGSGVLLYRLGILGVKSGVTKFSLDINGDANFAGTLSAAIGSLGAITTALITLDSSGYIRGGATDYLTGVGLFLGYSGGAYKFSVGNPAGDFIAFNGSILTVTASQVAKLFTAGMSITAGRAVYIHTDGKVYSTDALSSYQTARYLGFALENISKDASGKIQTFGNITGLSGLTIASHYYLKDATHTADQSFDLADNLSGIAPVEVSYQSFTTGVGITELSAVKVSLSVVIESTVTMRIRVGEGTGGTLLWTQIFTPATADVTIYLDTPIVLSASTQYSITLMRNDIGASISWKYKLTGGYSGGRSDLDAGADYNFTTYYSTNRGLLNSTSGTNSKKVGIAISTTEISVKDSI
jgi:hypothetical protein